MPLRRSRVRGPAPRVGPCWTSGSISTSGSEVDRAADVFSQRAQAGTRQFQPLVSEHTNRLLRWLRIVLVVVVALVIGWFVFESIAQITILAWLGERIET